MRTMQGKMNGEARVGQWLLLLFIRSLKLIWVSLGWSLNRAGPVKIVKILHHAWINCWDFEFSLLKMTLPRVKRLSIQHYGARTGCTDQKQEPRQGHDKLVFLRPRQNENPISRSVWTSNLCHHHLMHKCLFAVSVCNKDEKANLKWRLE